MHVTVCWKLRARYSSGAYPASGRPLLVRRHGPCPDLSSFPLPLLDRSFRDHMIVECLDDVIVQFVGPRHQPIRIGIEVPLDEVVHVDQRDPLPCLRPWPGWNTSSGTPWTSARR